MNASENSWRYLIRKWNSKISQYSESAWNSIKRNKDLGIDIIHVSISLNIYHQTKYPLFVVFRSSIEKDVFPNLWKIPELCPILKCGDASDVSNYRTILVLPLFSNVLERIMYNRVFDYLRESQLLFIEQFGFQVNNSMEHELLQLINNITNRFEKKLIDLWLFYLS